MTDLSPTPELLSVTEAARVAGVSLRTMRRWVSCGQVVTVGRGRARRVAAASLSRHGDNGDTNGHDVGASVPAVSATSDTERAIGANGAVGDTATGATGDPEAVHLAGLVRALAAENRQLAEAAAVWQERARVLTERLAIAAPDATHSPGAPHLTPPARLGSLGPWLLLAALLLAAGVLGWLR